jgi:sugar phosphate isomerase/epimerase
MRTLKGPAIFLAQFAGDSAPFNTFDGICKWAADLGYKGVQIPTWVSAFIDLEKAAESKTYADELNGVAAKHGLKITELSTHLQGQLVAVHPAYDTMFDGFAPPQVHNNPKARQEWAVKTLMSAAKASKNLGLTEHATFSGALAWLISIRSRSARPASSKRPSTNWRAAGRRSSTSSIATASTSAMRSIRARICMTASPTRCSSNG